MSSREKMVTNSFKNKNVMQSMRRFNMSSREKMVTNSFENKNVMQSMRRLNMSSRDFLFWVLGGEEWAGRKRREVWLCIYSGEWGGPRGASIGDWPMFQKNWRWANQCDFFFLFRKTNFHWPMVVHWPFQRQISKIIMSFSNLTTFFFFLIIIFFLLTCLITISHLS